jgi:hypothetical protein
MRSSWFSLLSSLALASACAPHPSTGQSTATPLDSVVLERTPCYGTCPAYRLAILRNGRVTFRSANPSETPFEARDSVAPSILDAIARDAERISFHTLPDTIERDKILCADHATDHPAIIISLYGDRTKKVVYDTGCYVVCCQHDRADALKDLASFATEIDDKLGARRWIRPGRIR